MGKANELGDTERQFWTGALSDRSSFVKKFQILSKTRISKGSSEDNVDFQSIFTIQTSS